MNPAASFWQDLARQKAPPGMRNRQPGNDEYFFYSLRLLISENQILACEILLFGAGNEAKYARLVLRLLLAAG
jgi:hypothetical protein